MRPIGPQPPNQPPQRPAPNMPQGPSSDRSDVISGFLDTAARFCLYGGLAALLIGLGVLIFTFSAFASGTPQGASPAQALANIGGFSTLLFVGGVAAIVGSAYLFWGEELTGVLQVAFSALLFFAPALLPSVIPITPNEVNARAAQTIQMGGMVMGILSIGVLAFDVANRAKLRAQQGSRSDQLKFGKGVKEEKDIRNVFMGKCWQLPFCRKFIREKCPIYHSKRTCWRERVGCMCEEEVVRKAMEGRAIPKDMVAAAKFIPYNHKLPMAAKMERCRQCVIYNEHQKHKYKMVLGLTLVAYVAVYALLRTPLLSAMNNVINNLDRIVQSVTFSRGGAVAKAASGMPLAEILLICVMFMALAYTLKGLEYAIFKLKI